jgi:non-specific serine/threonine protein kinase
VGLALPRRIAPQWPVVDSAAENGGGAASSEVSSGGEPTSEAMPREDAAASDADESGAQSRAEAESNPKSVAAPPSEPPLASGTPKRSPAASATAVSQTSVDPPGEIAPAESDVPPPPKAGRRSKAKTVTLSEAEAMGLPPSQVLGDHTTQKRAAAHALAEDGVDEEWAAPSPSPSRPSSDRSRPGPPKPAVLPLRSSARKAPRPLPASSPASLGLGARPNSARPNAARPHPASAPSASSPGASSPGASSPGAGSPGTAGAPTDLESSDDDLPTTEADRPPELLAEMLAEPTDTNIRLPDPSDADATTALPTQPRERRTATRAGGAEPTATALHEEDEDGPTIVNYPAAAVDDEATAVHPSRGPFLAPIAPAPGAPPPRPLATTAELPPSANPFAAVGNQREAAVLAALAAATEAPTETERDPQREQQLVVASAVLLGVGMVLGALGAYLTASAIAAGRSSAGASLAGANVTCCISLFAAGFATLQPKENARVALSVGAAVMQVVCFIWMLVAAFS